MVVVVWEAMGEVAGCVSIWCEDVVASVGEAKVLSVPIQILVTFSLEDSMCPEVVN